MQVRKWTISKEVTETDGVGKPCDPLTRVVGAAVFTNPFASRFVDDLSVLFDIGADLGEILMSRMTSQFNRQPICYGKAAIVGIAGDLEHAAAVIHPKLGSPMRAAIGGGKALIPSNAKVATTGASIDLPLGHKDDAWSFDHFDTITVTIFDAPRPDELALFVGLADGSRPHPRVGRGPIR